MSSNSRYGIQLDKRVSEVSLESFTRARMQSYYATIFAHESPLKLPFNGKKKSSQMQTETCWYILLEIGQIWVIRKSER